MLAIEQSQPDWYEFSWEYQDIGWVDPQDEPWSFPEMLMRAIDLEDAPPKQYLVGDDGKFHPDREELERVRWCIDARLRHAAGVVSLRWPTNSERPDGLACPLVTFVSGPRWAHLDPECKRVRETLEPSD